MCVVCVHSIIHIVWDWVVIKMCHVKVLVLCVFGQLYECVVEVCMSHSKGNVRGGWCFIGDSCGEVRGVCVCGGGWVIGVVVS